MILVVGRVRTNDEKRDNLVQISQAVAQASRDEAGCIGYRFYAETEDADAYVFIEEWRDLEALREHFATPHIATFMQAIPDAIVGTPDVQVHDVSRTIGLAEAASG